MKNVFNIPIISIVAVLNLVSCSSSNIDSTSKIKPESTIGVKQQTGTMDLKATTGSGNESTSSTDKQPNESTINSTDIQNNF